MTQHQQVLSHIHKAGSISAYEAILNFGITRLAARIWELRQQGYEFNTERKVNPTTKKQYVRYSLAS